MGAISVHSCGVVSSSFVRTFLSAVTGNCHILLHAIGAVIALATKMLVEQTVNVITYIGLGSCRLAGVHHWPVVVSNTSILLKRVCLSSAINSTHCHNNKGIKCSYSRSDTLGRHYWKDLLPTLSSPCHYEIGDSTGCCLLPPY